MARKPRSNKGNTIYHVLNRANARKKIFETENDYLLFKNILQKTARMFDMRILSYCIMPNHWHLLLYPREDVELSLFMKKLTETHAQQYHKAHGTTGTGHIYQDRYKSFSVKNDTHLYTLYGYIESNPLRAGLVSRCEEWKWSSLQERLHRGGMREIICESPIDLPSDYLASINAIKGI